MGSVSGLARVEEILSTFLAKRVSNAQDAPELYEEIQRFVATGGKRLRPAFCLAGFQAASGEDLEGAATAAAALELLHAFALMHDDIMDRSPVRRGAPTSHVKLAGLPELRADVSRFGESAAILAGDLAMVLADLLWTEATERFPATRAAGNEQYQLMREEVVAGQFLDLQTAAIGRATSEQSRRISVLKSGRYTVERPLLIGASLAGASEDLKRTLQEFGAPVGEAFQLRDDVLGVFGDPAVTGKDSSGDIREGKRTLLVTTALDRATEQQREVLTSALGDAALDETGADQVRSVIRNTGALDHVIGVMDDLLSAALEALASIPDAPAEQLADLARSAVVRDV